MPVDASIYGALNLPGRATGLATLGDLQALKLVKEQREAETAEAHAKAAKAQREQQQSALIQSAVQKHQRPDGTIDRKGLINEVTALDLEAGQKLASSFVKMDGDAANARKTELDNENAVWGQASRLLQGVTPQTYKPVWSRINSLDADLASILTPDYDPERVKGVMAMGTERSEYNKEHKAVLDEEASNRDKALKLLAIAKIPEHWQDALDFAKAHDVDDDLAQMGVDPNFTPEGQERIKAFLAPLQGADKKSFQSKDLMLGGKRVTVNFDPQTGEYLDQDGKPVKGLSPIPPVSAGGGTGQGASGGLTPDAVDFEAAKYRVLGASSIPTRVGEQDRLKIMNAAAQQSKQLGVTPVGGIQKQLATKADQTSLNQLRKLASSAEASESKAIGQADIVADLSKKVPRTFSPLINRALLSGKREMLGDPNATLLANALTTFTSEYAKIIEGSTGSVAASSDSARKAAERLASANMNPETLQKTLDLMKREMRLTLQGYDASIEHVMDRIGSPTAAGATPSRGSARDPMGIR